MIDYQAIFGGEDYDPCAALQALRPAYMEAVANGGVRRAKFRDRDVEFNTTNLKEFGSIIARLEQECAAKRGAGRRRAITAGYRRHIT